MYCQCMSYLNGVWLSVVSGCSYKIQTISWVCSNLTGFGSFISELVFLCRLNIHFCHVSLYNTYNILKNILNFTNNDKKRPNYQQVHMFMPCAKPPIFFNLLLCWRGIYMYDVRMHSLSFIVLTFWMLGVVVQI